MGVPCCCCHRNVYWTAFDKPYQMLATQNDGSIKGSIIKYGPGQNRIYKEEATFSSLGVKSAVTERTVYLGKDYERIEKKDDSGNWQTIHRYTIATGGNAIQIERDDGTDFDRPKYLLGDNLGSTNVIINAMGEIEQRLAFDPWGMRMSVPGSGGAVNKLTNRGYTGHEMDDEVGLINMNARIYDPLLGRFLSADPVLPNAGDMQQFNRYSYVGNNPLGFVDPSGNSQESVEHFQGSYHIPNIVLFLWAGTITTIGDPNSGVEPAVSGDLDIYTGFLVTISSGFTFSEGGIETSSTVSFERVVTFLFDLVFDYTVGGGSSERDGAGDGEGGEGDGPQIALGIGSRTVPNTLPGYPGSTGNSYDPYDCGVGSESGARCGGILDWLGDAVDSSVRGGKIIVEKLGGYIKLSLCIDVPSACEHILHSTGKKDDERGPTAGDDERTYNGQTAEEIEEALNVDRDRGEFRRKPGSLGKRKNRDGLRRENRAPADAAREVGLTDPDDLRKFHDRIHSQGITDYQDLKDNAQDVKDGNF